MEDRGLHRHCHTGVHRPESSCRALHRRSGALQCCSQNTSHCRGAHRRAPSHTPQCRGESLQCPDLQPSSRVLWLHGYTARTDQRPQGGCRLGADHRVHWPHDHRAAPGTPSRPCRGGRPRSRETDICDHMVRSGDISRIGEIYETIPAFNIYQ